MIYGRTAVILLLILIQILVMVFGIYFLTDSWTYLYGVFSIIGTIAVIYIINSEDNPAFKLTWVLCIMALPIFGTFFYIYVKSERGILERGLKPFGKRPKSTCVRIWRSLMP